MNYELRAELSACHVDGHFIFLDILEDRYFHLSPGLENIYSQYLAGSIDNESDLSPLLDRGILTRSRRPHHSRPIGEMAHPESSALELMFGTERFSMRPLTEIASLALSTRLSLASWKLHKVLDSMHAHRSKYGRQIHTDTSMVALIEYARMFRHLRLYVPIEPRCLLDSIALVRFLARRNLYSNLVFGVTGDPFSAHCWVQSGPVVLNDTIGNVQAYQPIRVT